MSGFYDLHADGELFVVRWRRPTEPAARALALAVEGHFEQVGRPLVLVVLVGADCPTPEPRAREALLSGHDRVYECCRSIRAVVVGAGIRRQLMRGVLTAMTLAAGLRGKGFAIDRSVTGMADFAADSLGRDPARLLDQLVGAGLLAADELGP